tara:strand:- start:1447 stop:2547 length:1101 start_codon:yes stop_codon:yes gene_type:complete
MSPVENRSIIEINNVTKDFGSVRALNGVSMQIKQGEFFSLLGPSGCGKTTLLRMISGFETPTSGSIYIAGESMADVSPNLRPTNMVFQSYAIFPHLNVAENVGYGLKKLKLSSDEIEARINEALSLVDLTGFGDREAHALSGGQRQRVALARALIMQPKVLLLDEPLSALDKKLREAMQVELRRLQQTVGITFVLVTHDQEEALVMSDRIAVMFEGEVAQVDTPEFLYREPCNKQVASFIGVMNFVPARVIKSSVNSVEIEIETLGVTKLPAKKKYLAGSKVTIGIRPEMLTIVYDKKLDQQKIFEATVSAKSYFGDMTYYEVLFGTTKIKANVSMRNTVGTPVLEPGTRTHVAWGNDSLTIIDDN